MNNQMCRLKTNLIAEISHTTVITYYRGALKVHSNIIIWTVKILLKYHESTINYRE